jgi:hypothetical protein
MNLDPSKFYADVRPDTSEVMGIITGLDSIPERFMKRRLIVEIPEGVTVLPGQLHVPPNTFIDKPVFEQTDASNMDKIDRVTKAMGLVIAEVSGRTPAQIKAIFKTKYDLLG